MDLELRHLRLILAIADAGSVTKAAATLGVAQPALTTQLRRVERLLGGPLFVRGRRGVTPTELGDLVLSRARLLLPAVSDLHASALRTVGDTARFRVGATNGPIVGGLVQRLSDAYPGRPVSVHATWSENEIVRLVQSGRLDYALVGACATGRPGSDEAVGLEWRTVSVDPVWVLLDARHPLAGGLDVGLADLAGERWVSAPGDGCFNECFAAACARSGFTPLFPYEMDAGAVFDVVTSGRAVALCQATVRDVPGAVAVPLRDSPLSWRHLIGWDPSAPAAALAPDVIALAAASYRDIVTRRPRYAGWLAAHPAFGHSVHP
ncbi:LysR family transcriptional regulator [Paractinoplanes lichenicola]|uniref:LysR family transcriptional regulator n=1 Tax=Paractinoplanes lichenicola TaxID=2802976 RepID=A0ABS1VW93_9ACTN|nr:LysR family transcriptional regulator [Actinoplanes lichenicola]MBL7258756.1 LysR family transcriptional regulator [Actinoplanes lichenicola]